MCQHMMRLNEGHGQKCHAGDGGGDDDDDDGGDDYDDDDDGFMLLKMIMP